MGGEIGWRPPLPSPPLVVLRGPGGTSAPEGSFGGLQDSQLRRDVCCHTEDVKGRHLVHKPLFLPVRPCFQGGCWRSVVVGGQVVAASLRGRPRARGTPAPSIIRASHGAAPSGRGKADGCSSLRHRCRRAGMPQLLLDHTRALLVSSPDCRSKPREREM